MTPTVAIVRPRVQLRRSANAWELDGLHRLDLDGDVRITAMLDRRGLHELVAQAWARLSEPDRAAIGRRALEMETAAVRHLVQPTPSQDLRAAHRV